MYDPDERSAAPTPDLFRKHLSGLDTRKEAGRKEFFLRWTGSNNPDLYRYVDITSDMAEWFLTHMDFRYYNRCTRVRHARVFEYQQAMKQGTWSPQAGTHLVWSLDGRLANGYGRLTALASLHDLTISTPIIGPWPSNRIEFLDRDVPRTAKHDVEMWGGMPSKLQPALFVNVTEIIRRHVLSSTTQHACTYQEHKVLRQRFQDAYTTMHNVVGRKRTYQKFRSAPVIAAFTYAYRHTEGAIQAHVLDIWKAVTSMSNLASGTPEHSMMIFITTRNQPTCLHDRVAMMQRLFHGIDAALMARPLKNLTLKFTHIFDDPSWSRAFIGLTAPTPEGEMFP